MTSASRTLTFADARLPHEIRCQLERDHLTRLQPSTREDARLEYRGESRCNSMHVVLSLLYLAAEPNQNQYALHIHLSWDHLPPEHHAYFLKTSRSWMDLWCSQFQSHPSPLTTTMTELYQQRSAEALRAEAHLTSVPALQQEILSALRAGATFSTSHKEGGTRIGHARGRFYREDYGESSAHEVFKDEAVFLSALHRFFEWEISRNVAPATLPDDLAWLLIYRLLKKN